MTSLTTSISGERNGGGYAQSVILAGTDVYVVGGYDSLNGTITAAYWKNGVLTPLQNNVSNSSFANGIAMAGNDNGEIKSVYVTHQ